MGTMRVTQGLMVQRVLRNLNRNTQRIFELQTQLATGLKVNTPSDNPLAARRAINTRNEIDKDEQYVTNISSAGPQLLETVSSIQTVVDVMQRVRELTLQGASGTNGQDSLDALAAEVDQLLENVLTEANHETNERFVFGGTRTSQTPFVVTRDADGRITAVTYQGNQERIEIPVADNTTVTVNENGAQVFLDTQDVFQTLIDIRDNMLAGDQAALQSDRLVEIDRGMDQLLLAMARIGATQNRLERLSENTQDYVVQLRAVLSDNIDADYAETVINLDAQSNAYQAALQAAASVIQPSLLQFVR
jgi:flagellar hook-associated protein 3 FlgL